MSLLQSFIDKNGLMFHKYHLLNQLQVFMRYKKLPKMSFNIPLKVNEILKIYLIEQKIYPNNSKLLGYVSDCTVHCTWMSAAVSQTRVL